MSRHCLSGRAATPQAIDGPDIPRLQPANLDVSLGSPGWLRTGANGGGAEEASAVSAQMYDKVQCLKTTRFHITHPFTHLSTAARAGTKKMGLAEPRPAPANKWARPEACD